MQTREIYKAQVLLFYGCEYNGAVRELIPALESKGVRVNAVYHENELFQLTLVTIQVLFQGVAL